MILITGATGNIGGEIVRQFQESAAKQSIPLRAIVRTPAKATALVERGVEVVQGDFNDVESLHRALNGVDQVFLTIPEGQA